MHSKRSRRGSLASMSPAGGHRDNDTRTAFLSRFQISTLRRTRQDNRGPILTYVVICQQRLAACRFMSSLKPTLRGRLFSKPAASSRALVLPSSAFLRKSAPEYCDCSVSSNLHVLGHVQRLKELWKAARGAKPTNNVEVVLVRKDLWKPSLASSVRRFPTKKVVLPRQFRECFPHAPQRLLGFIRDRGARRHIHLKLGQGIGAYLRVRSAPFRQ